VVYPAWSAAPPASFALLQGPDALQLGLFWLPGHILLTLALFPTLALNWSVPGRRALILIGVVGYLLMRATTFLYFLPELTLFLATPPDAPFSPDLAARADRWGALSVVRMVVIAFLTGALVVAYGRSDRPTLRDSGAGNGPPRRRATVVSGNG
jgi:hypothetical protein